MSGLVQNIALVSQSSEISLGETLKISAALQKQVTRDFGPIWETQATVDSFASIDDVPAGYWPIIIRNDINQPGAAGIHLDRNGQPYALVQASEGTPLTCSHELLEMLADPFGNRLVSADSINPKQGRVRYLVEVCDPSEADLFGYTVNGILLSDFYTPHFFDPVSSPNVRYSFTGAIKEPKQVLEGGYLSWMDPQSGAWWQATYFGSSLTFTGPHNWERKSGQSWREVVSMQTVEPHKKLQGKKLTKTRTANAVFFSPSMKSASSGWASALMEDVDSIIEATKS